VEVVVLAFGKGSGEGGGETTWTTVLIGVIVLCVCGMVIAQVVGLIDVLW
jgi:hypothetical protein